MKAKPMFFNHVQKHPLILLLLDSGVGEVQRKDRILKRQAVRFQVSIISSRPVDCKKKSVK